MPTFLKNVWNTCSLVINPKCALIFWRNIIFLNQLISGSLLSITESMSLLVIFGAPSKNFAYPCATRGLPSDTPSLPSEKLIPSVVSAVRAARGVGGPSVSLDCEASDRQKKKIKLIKIYIRIGG